MSDTSPFDPALVTKTVNFHGHNLLKQLVSENAAQIHTIKLQDIDYKIYSTRALEIRTKPNGFSLAQEIVEFIATKANILLTPQPKWTLPTEPEESYKDRYKHQLPLEYFLNVDKQTKINELFKLIEVEDFLFTEVVNYSENGPSSAVLKLLGFDCGKHRYCSFFVRLTDMHIIMKAEDTEVPKTDEDRYGRWMVGTRLRVEVLSISTVPNKYIYVGTKGVTNKNKSVKRPLGKVLLSDLPPILSVAPDPSIHCLSECLEKMDSFKNPQSNKLLASRMNLDIRSYPSLMSSLRRSFPDCERADKLRKAQMCKWAHKSVADGVTHFKKGQHEEAFQCLNKALQIDPENVEASVAKGALLANLGKYEKAIEEFEKSLSFNPTHTNARKYMCETLVELGKHLEEKEKLKEAEKCFSRCLELNKDHNVAQESMTALKSKLGEDSEVTLLQSSEKKEIFLKDLLEMENELKQRNMKEVEEKLSVPLKTEEEKEEKEKEEERRIIQVIGDLIPTTDMNNKREDKREPSLSPLSQKLAMQQNMWAPPPSINTNLSYIFPLSNTEKSATPPLLSIPPLSMFSNPPPNWRVPDITQPPPSVNSDISKGILSEDASYRAKVEQFLRELQNRSGPTEKKRSASRERSSSRKKAKHRDGKKRHKHRESSKSSSSSRSSSSSSSSSSGSSSSDDHKSSKKSKSKKSKKKRHKKNKKAAKKHREKKKHHGDKGEENKEEKPSIKAEMPMPNFEDLEEKLLAYYKKMEVMNSAETAIVAEQKEKVEAEKISSEAEYRGKKKAPKSNDSLGKKLLPVTHPLFEENDSDDSHTSTSESRLYKNVTSKRKSIQAHERSTLSSPSSITSSESYSSRSRSEEKRSGLRGRRSRSKGRRSRSKGRRSRGRRSRSRGRRARSRGRRSKSRGRRSRSRGRRSRSRGRRSRSRGRRSISRRRSIRYSSRSRSREKPFVKTYRRSNSRSKERPHNSRKSPPFGYYKNKPFFSTKLTGGKDLTKYTTVLPPSSELPSLPARPRPLSSGAPPPTKHELIKFEIKKKSDLSTANMVRNAKERIQKHILSNVGNDGPKTEVGPDENTRFGKWGKDSSQNGSRSDVASKLPQSLDMFEDFLDKEKQKNKELMKERNKEFLKPRLD